MNKYILLTSEELRKIKIGQYIAIDSRIDTRVHTGMDYYVVTKSKGSIVDIVNIKSGSKQELYKHENYALTAVTISYEQLLECLNQEMMEQIHEKVMGKIKEWNNEL